MDNKSHKRAKKASRIDHILISSSLTKFYKEIKHKYSGGLSEHNAIILTMDWCQTPKGPGTFKAGIGLHRDPVYVEAISHIIKVSIASYISDEHIKNSILELLNSKKETDELIHKLDTDSENKEANKEAL